MKTNPVVLSVVSAAVLCAWPAALPVSAQPVVPASVLVYQPLSDQQLDQLLSPIALYPDPLLAQLLPASTLPTEIVLADRYLAGGGDPNLISEQGWDGSVQAMARYPSILQYLDNNLAWTTQLGQAFANQQSQVMESIQRLRLSAQNYGNLTSTPQQEVVMDGSQIEIEPVQPTIIYLPVYDPTIVYYESGCPETFGLSCTLGAWLDGDFDWRGHHVYFWGPNRPRPINWWRRPPSERANWAMQTGAAWQPGHHGGHGGHGAPGNNNGHDGGWNGGDHGWHGGGNGPLPTGASSGAGSGHMGGSSRPVVNPRPPVSEHPITTAGSHSGYRPENPVMPAHPVVPPHPVIPGGRNSSDPREFAGRSPEPPRSVERSEPVHVEPPHAAEPPHSAPTHSEPAHANPQPASGGSHNSNSNSKH